MRTWAVAFALSATACSGSSSTTSGSGPPGFQVLLETSTAAQSFNDGNAGQTAKNVVAGVRSFTLEPDGGGPGWTLFDNAAAPVKVGYDDGDRTVLVLVAPADVKPGHYTRVRMVQDWSRFDVDATLHDGGTATPGVLHATLVTSDGSTLDGQPRGAGYYSQDFTGGSGGHWEGTDAPVPDHSATAGAEAVVENGEWAVYFPVDVTVGSGNATLHVVANMDHAFRWTDVSGGGNQDGVYDIAPPVYEPVAQFGANRFDVTLAPR